MASVYIFVSILIHCFIFHKLPLSASGYDLTIVHNNDVHAHYDQTSVYSGECSDTAASEGKCYGGEARRVTVIKDARANIPNTVVLDAGDRFVGRLACFNTILYCTWPRGYKTFFMLNSTEHEFFPALKC